MTPQPTAASRLGVTLTLQQRLLLAAHAATPFPRDAALVLGEAIEDFEDELRTIRQLFRAAGYATHTRRALVISAQLAGQLPGP